MMEGKIIKPGPAWAWAERTLRHMEGRHIRKNNASNRRRGRIPAGYWNSVAAAVGAPEGRPAADVDGHKIS